MPPFAVGGRNVREKAIREGHEIFTNELTRFARRAGDVRITALIAQLRGPLRVAVLGRDGVGRATVAAALADAGLIVSDDNAEVSVVVVAETLKPEDRAMLGAVPSLLVLNKADLAGFGAGGPIAVADRRAAELQAMTGVPTVSMVGLLAAATVDEELVAALRVLTVEPVDLMSVDGFLAANHSLARDVRERLLDTLDLFGIAHGVLALRQGAEAAALPAVLRRLSQVDRVMARLAAVGAEARYRRLHAALVTLRTMAVDGAPGMAEFLSGDDAVIATMAAAVDVVEAAGLTVDDGDDPSAHLRRALHWHRYSRGPVSHLHGRCAADICRGSLRLLQRAEAR
ncbi:hypothetical protein [Mycobacterium sp. ITM-2016-00318]|uniref:hypothetical protein n=1 Tax=Mycobacterium sp. ITM-2016-00318 TaxID=2099693 RepID=UPI0026CFE965